MSEAANPEGADARSPRHTETAEYRATFIAIEELLKERWFKERWDSLNDKRAWRIMENIAARIGTPGNADVSPSPALSATERAAESRGAKAGRAEAAEYLERSAQDMRMRGTPWTGFGLLVMHAQRIRSLSAEGAPSGSPSVPAAQPQERPEPPHSLPHTRCDCKGLWLQPWMVAITTTDGASHARDSCSDQEGRPLVDAQQPRAAPSPALPREGACICYGMPPGEHSSICPALPREAPEQGGTPAELPSTPEEHEEGRGPWHWVRAERCYAPEEPVYHLADGRGSMRCGTDIPGYVVREEPYHPARRCLRCKAAMYSARPRAAPSDSAPATPGLGQPSAKCPECEGRGWVPGRAYDGSEYGVEVQDPCPRCAAGPATAEAAPSSPESPAGAADAGDRNHE